MGSPKTVRVPERGASWAPSASLAEALAELLAAVAIEAEAVEAVAVVVVEVVSATEKSPAMDEGVIISGEIAGKVASNATELVVKVALSALGHTGEPNASVETDNNKREVIPTMVGLERTRLLNPRFDGCLEWKVIGSALTKNWCSAASLKSLCCRCPE